ncbi:capsular polysaccharide biosynthesis protein [Symbiobacterium terraclitae]|uniref:Capsular polysaccharide biosynthesis protein n=1 Tax=Symbiobacterium terraclitae TaxID=557451 RepID=A0ABS4JXY8_9FIRM|nr:capsular polysaccharide biosynthesis protein [Symbiobacterium terraclitae]
MADDRISLREILAMLGRRFVWVLLPLVLFTGLAVAATFYMMPVYEASTTLILTTPTGSPTNYETLLFNRNLAKTYSEVARSRSVAAEAAAMLGLQESVEEFQERIRVSVVRDTEVIEIAVIDTDPVRAADAANALASAFRSRFWQFTFLDSLRIVDPAEPPVEPIRPQPVLYITVGVVVGLASGVGLAALVDHLFPRRPRREPTEPAALTEDAGQAIPAAQALMPAGAGGPGGGGTAASAPLACRRAAGVSPAASQAACASAASAQAVNVPAGGALTAGAPAAAEAASGAPTAGAPAAAEAASGAPLAGAPMAGPPPADAPTADDMTAGAPADILPEEGEPPGSAPVTSSDAEGESPPTAPADVLADTVGSPLPLRRRRRYRHRFRLRLRWRAEADPVPEGPSEGMGEVHA